MFEVLVCSENNKNKSNLQDCYKKKRRSIINRSPETVFIAFTLHTQHCAKVHAFGRNWADSDSRGVRMPSRFLRFWFSEATLGEPIGRHSLNQFQVASLWNQSCGSLKQVRVLLPPSRRATLSLVNKNRFYQPLIARMFLGAMFKSLWPALVFSVINTLKVSKHLLTSGDI